jgi:hypothetical protein
MTIIIIMIIITAITAYYKMTEENIPGSEYVNVSADSISSWCTSSRGTIFTSGGDI